MHQFPLIESIAAGVKRAWSDRFFIMPMLGLPLLVVFASAFLMIHVLDLTSLFYISIVLLPSEFLKAIFVVLYFRYLVLGEVIKTEAEIDKQDKAQAITGGVVAIVLVNYLMVGVLQGMQMVNGLVQQQTADSAYAAIVFLLMIAAMIGAFWLARFFFLYVPIALNQSVKAFFARYKGMGGSMRIFLLVFGCVFLAAVPALLLEVIGRTALTGVENSGLQMIIKTLVLFFKVACEMVGLAILTAATAYAVTYRPQS